ncbi:unnamed protein product [Rangifer tarandus platyrhynchus]|uniref:Uncharacterized protein n=2 Tax=Rangifer tarandus platyrhynchus TaxID=3082113 RepID=A0AC59YNV2_RANTA|nr:unnamed protein product [Rangifer tarandus platyrhynchus]
MSTHAAPFLSPPSTPPLSLGAPATVALAASHPVPLRLTSTHVRVPGSGGARPWAAPPPSSPRPLGVQSSAAARFRLRRVKTWPLQGLHCVFPAGLRPGGPILQAEPILGPTEGQLPQPLLDSEKRSPSSFFCGQLTTLQKPFLRSAATGSTASW